MTLNWTHVEPALTLENNAYAANFSIALDVCRAGYQEDYVHAKQIKPLIFEPIQAIDQEQWGKDLSSCFFEWREGIPPTIPTLIGLGMDVFGIDKDHPLSGAVLTAACLAEVPHFNAYHNTYHFREVVVMALRLIATHNAINTDSHLQLSHTDMLLLLIAACIHDLGHDGLGNVIDGVHVPSRLEKKAFFVAEPYLSAVGMSEGDLKSLQAMLIATDVSRSAQGHSPSTTLRRIYEAHFDVGWDNAFFDVTEDLLIFRRNEKLTLLASLLCEADLAPSSGLTYDFSSMLTCLVAEESSVLQPSAATLYGFIHFICDGRFLTPAARAHMAENFGRIAVRAEEDKDKDVVFTQNAIASTA